MRLGMQELWARAGGKRNRVHRVNCGKRPTESEVWGRVIDEVNGLGPGIQFIHVCDRGADNFDVFAHLYLKGDSWVIRAVPLKRKLRTADGTVLKLDEILASAFVMDNEVREVPTNIVEVLEVKAPKGSAAIRWVLYTRESVASFNPDYSSVLLRSRGWQVTCWFWC